MFSRLLTSGLFAGAAAGLIAAVLQLYFVQPVLLHAELYEAGDLVHFGATATVAADQDLGGIDLVRDGLSIVFTMLVYSGYAMVLVSLMSVAESRGAVINGRTGLLWGTAGFVAVHLAPGFSLAPEVPGAAAADITLRQYWWFATVACAGGAMWLAAFGKSWMAWSVAVILLLAPHIYGAPQPDVFTGPVPTELGALFAARALGVGLAAWVMVGGFAGYFWSRQTGASDIRQTV
ncbi:MAG: CbtA family protein [Roseobacter sp.]|jgi:cobalt transporter subunit CbtA